MRQYRRPPQRSSRESNAIWVNASFAIRRSRKRRLGLVGIITPAAFAAAGVAKVACREPRCDHESCGCHGPSHSRRVIFAKSFSPSHSREVILRQAVLHLTEPQRAAAVRVAGFPPEHRHMKTALIALSVATLALLSTPAAEAKGCI